jgi:cbb3-type cytochrome oxidase maturation protein
MGVLVIMIGASLLLAIGFLVAFLFAVKNGQYEDDYSPSVRILFENKPRQKNTNSEKNKSLYADGKLRTGKEKG